MTVEQVASALGAPAGEAVATVQQPGRYIAALARRVAETGNVMCLGLDPDPAALPAGYPTTVAGIERFARLLLEAAGPYAAAVKPNVAFFEAFGSAGLSALERVRAHVPDGVPVVLDAKRGDIASTVSRQAVALFDILGADAVTANPYLGADGLEPLLARRDRFVYVLCRTSNPGAAELQDLTFESADGRRLPLHRHVARTARAWQERFGTVGLVVGATAPDELAVIREDAPDLPFLVPGVGTQGGDTASVMTHGGATVGAASDVPGRGLLVNVSRGIARAATEAADPEAAVTAAAREWSDRLRVLA